MIAGTELNAAYRGTPWEAWCRSTWRMRDFARANSRRRRRVSARLTIHGLRGTSIFRMADTESETLEIWRRLPDLHWIFGSCAPQARHAGLRGVASRRPPSDDVPIVVMESVGAGKVLFHATDEFWRWRFRAGDHYYGPFWSRAVRYPSRSRLLGRDRTAELTPIDLSIHRASRPASRPLLRRKFVPAATVTVTVTLERRNGERRTVALATAAGHATVFEGEALRCPWGRFTPG